jgi:hypothetical protein
MFLMIKQTYVVFSLLDTPSEFEIFLWKEDKSGRAEARFFFKDDALEEGFEEELGGSFSCSLIFVLPGRCRDVDFFVLRGSKEELFSLCFLFEERGCSLCSPALFLSSICDFDL